MKIKLNLTVNEVLTYDVEKIVFKPSNIVDIFLIDGGRVCISSNIIKKIIFV